MSPSRPASPETRAPVRLGIVGLGNFGLLHAKTAAAIAEAELVALVDRNAESLKAAESSCPGVPAWTDLAEALEKADAEAWIVATSTASHAPLARMILEAGHSLLLEKPVAPNLGEARSVETAADSAEGRVMLGHVALFNSEFQQLRREAARRGRVRHLDCVRHRPRATLSAFPGESPFHLTMVHDLYLALALMNGAEPEEWSAHQQRDDSGATDLALARLRWEDGALASFTASFKTPEGLGSEGFDRMEVFGDGWMARIEPNPRPLELWDDRARWPSTLEISTGEEVATGMLAEQTRCFCRVVMGREEIPLGARLEDGVRVMGWLDRFTEEASRNPVPKS